MAVNSGLAVMFMLGNAGGVGPGHSALVVGSDVYSFEDIGFHVGDSWRILSTREFILQKNRTRPAIVQELSSAVQLKPLMAFLVESIQAGDLWAVDGFCSDLAAVAVSRGTLGRYVPRGILPPHELFRQLQRAGLVSRSYYYWPDQPPALAMPGAGVSHSIIAGRLQREFPDLPRAPEDGILSWGKIRLPPTPVVVAPKPGSVPPEAAQAPRADWLTGVQYRLKFLKLYAGPVSGMHDSASKAAVMAFQRMQRITVDGIPGPITQGKLVSACGF